jgi:hypothetical protein
MASWKQCYMALRFFKESLVLGLTTFIIRANICQFWASLKRKIITFTTLEVYWMLAFRFNKSHLGRVCWFWVQGWFQVLGFYSQKVKTLKFENPSLNVFIWLQNNFPSSLPLGKFTPMVTSSKVFTSVGLGIWFFS